MNNNINKSSNGVMNRLKNRVSNTDRSTIGIIVGVAVILLILLVIYYLYSSSATTYSQNNPIWIDKPVNIFKSKIRPKKVPRKSNPYSFSYSMWIYVSDWNYRFGEFKNILVRKPSKDSKVVQPELGLYPKSNTLFTRISTVKGEQNCDIKDIPLQKWVNITYVLNNRNVDIYVDGKLERTCVLKGLPIVNRNSRVYIGEDGGFYGQISRLQFFSKSLSPMEVQTLYTSGPYDSKMFNVSFFNRGRVVSVESK